MRFVKTFRDHVEGAGPSDPLHCGAHRARLRPRRDLARQPWRVSPLVLDDGRHHLPIRQQGAVGVGVVSREARQLCDGPLEVQRHRERFAVEKRHGDNGIWPDVLEAVATKLQFVVPQHGIGLDQVVGARAGIVKKPWKRERFAGRVTPDTLGRLKDEHAKAGSSRVGGRDQAVVTGPGDHNVKALAHADSAAWPR